MRELILFIGDLNILRSHFFSALLVSKKVYLVCELEIPNIGMMKNTEVLKSMVEKIEKKWSPLMYNMLVRIDKRYHLVDLTHSFARSMCCFKKSGEEYKPPHMKLL